MKLTPLQKRALRRGRNSSMVDMNLVSLIDVFTILIFFLLSSAGVEAALPNSKAVQLPLSSAETPARETLVIVVSGTEIVVEGRVVTSVAQALAEPGELIPALKAELDVQSQRRLVRSDATLQKDGKGPASGQAITILGDKNIPYRLLRKVMATSAMAHFADVSFAVQRKNEL